MAFILEGFWKLPLGKYKLEDACVENYSRDFAKRSSFKSVYYKTVLCFSSSFKKEGSCKTWRQCSRVLCECQTFSKIPLQLFKEIRGKEWKLCFSRLGRVARKTTNRTNSGSQRFGLSFLLYWQLKLSANIILEPSTHGARIPNPNREANHMLSKLP